MIVRRALKIRKQLVTEESWMVVKTVTVLTQSASDITPGIQLSDKCDPSGGFGRLPASAGRALGSRAIPQAKPRTSEHQAPCRRSRVAAAPKSARALDGSGCPTEAPYGCFLPDLTKFGTCRHPNPSNALGARYILPAPARWGKVANLGRGFLTTWAIRSTGGQISPVPKRLVCCRATKGAYLLRLGRRGQP